MNLFSFITVTGSYTLQAGWSSALIVPEGSVQIVNSASPPEAITITAPLKLGNGSDLYGQLIINGTAKVIVNGDSIISNHVVPGSATWGSIAGNPVNQSDLQNGTIQGTFTPVNSAVVSGDTFKTAFAKLQGQVSGVDLSSRWALAGNALVARGSIGSTGATFGFGFLGANTVRGGLTDTTYKWFWGLTGAFADTDHSYGSTGNDNTTYNSQRKNGDSTVLSWLRDDGVLYSKNLLVGFSGGFGGDSLSEFWGTTSDNTAFSVKFRASSFDVMAQIRNDGVSAFRSILINPTSLTTGDDPNVAFSIYGGATNNASVYIAKFRKGDFATAFDIVSNGNLKMGEASDSFGGGQGVLQVGNALTDASSNPVNAFLLQAKSGRAMVYEADGSLSFLVKAVSATKTTAGAPYTNDGYVEGVINGNTIKFMTTA